MSKGSDDAISARRRTAHAVAVSQSTSSSSCEQLRFEPFPNPQDDVLHRRVIDELVEMLMVERIENALVDDALDAIEIFDHAARGPTRAKRSAPRRLQDDRNGRASAHIFRDETATYALPRIEEFADLRATTLLVAPSLPRSA